MRTCSPLNPAFSIEKTPRAVCLMKLMPPQAWTAGSVPRPAERTVRGHRRLLPPCPPRTAPLPASERPGHAALCSPRSPEPRRPPATGELTAAAALPRDRYRPRGEARQGRAGQWPQRERHLRRCGPADAARGPPPAGPHRRDRREWGRGCQGPGAAERSRSRSAPRPFPRHARAPHVPLAVWRGVAVSRCSPRRPRGRRPAGPARLRSVGGCPVT